MGGPVERRTFSASGRSGSAGSARRPLKQGLEDARSAPSHPDKHDSRHGNSSLCAALQGRACTEPDSGTPWSVRLRMRNWHKWRELGSRSAPLGFESPSSLAAARTADTAKMLTRFSSIMSAGRSCSTLVSQSDTASWSSDLNFRNATSVAQTAMPIRSVATNRARNNQPAATIDKNDLAALIVDVIGENNALLLLDTLTTLTDSQPASPSEGGILDQLLSGPRGAGGWIDIPQSSVAGHQESSVAGH